MVINLSICVIYYLFLFLFSVIMFLKGSYCLMNEMSYFYELELMSVNSSMIVMTILIDWMSCFFLSFVSLISCLVILYSKEYMNNDKNMNRFIMLILMFVFSMFLLIISPNLISILLGWDGLGLVSYCLVIYYQNIKSFNAGMLTFLSNRIGDVLILLSIAWMLNFGSWNYIFYLDIMKNDFYLKIIGSMLILAAMTKSAQIPFSAWLPAAMAAPTPVSALVHSSTLVTAGVYLLIRFNNLLMHLFSSKILLLISMLTMFMAGLGANFEFDLKKIIALSTLSQLGLMMSTLAMSLTYLAFFHLLTHALFKALLFMCAGMIIHNMKNFQDIRYMGSLILQMPMTIMNFNIANLALCGMPFLSGFYSKDLILEMVVFNNSINILSYFLFYFSTGLTVCYSFRLIYYTLYSNFNSWTYHYLNDNSITMIFSMMGLLIMTIIGGCILSWMIFPIPYFIILPLYLKLMTLMVCVLGGIMGTILSKWMIFLKSKIMKFKFSVMFFGSMWFLPFIVTVNITKYPLFMSEMYTKSSDYGWLETFMVKNLFYSFLHISSFLQVLMKNNLKFYFMVFFSWLIFYFFMMF
ncbi:NADH dehydrogenase subunit 5 (mitochondrion) [Culicoides brevitarsis]|uniref:NADH dehydrogenase subunit 5 n=1 Tax=Culicoides brevitarsis TaxID=469753 RepID=UPI002E79D9E1|nr:NADH dehydrogenase subunit 5 [Culicoides brevitarsis]WPN85964.1 NADH dehydrogenase subunit 5 [Culicoides brevitarsis]